ncbi:hypothetical protein ON010_g11367 [Phytophthora cinnamomi]|nr:hypothetical protein ON010_g11367 [Phytophthora cinnamomi]
MRLLAHQPIREWREYAAAGLQGVGAPRRLGDGRADRARAAPAAGRRGLHQPIPCQCEDKAGGAEREDDRGREEPEVGEDNFVAVGGVPLTPTMQLTRYVENAVRKARPMSAADPAQ